MDGNALISPLRFSGSFRSVSTIAMGRPLVGSTASVELRDCSASSRFTSSDVECADLGESRSSRFCFESFLYASMTVETAARPAGAGTGHCPVPA